MGKRIDLSWGGGRFQSLSRDCFNFQSGLPKKVVNQEDLLFQSLNRDCFNFQGVYDEKIV